MTISLHLSSLVLTTSRPVVNISPNSSSYVTFWKKNHFCTTSCLLSVTWTLWTDSTMQKHLNYHKPRDLEDRLSHTVLQITNSSYVIRCLIYNLFTTSTSYIFSYYFFTILYNPATAAIPNKPFYSNKVRCAATHLSCLEQQFHCPTRWLTSYHSHHTVTYLHSHITEFIKLATWPPNCPDIKQVHLSAYNIIDHLKHFSAFFYYGAVIR